MSTLVATLVSPLVSLAFWRELEQGLLPVPPVTGFKKTHSVCFCLRDSD